MNKLQQIAYNCRRATLLIEKQQLVRLTMTERAELRIHLTGCTVCRLFQQQSNVINKMIKDLLHTRGELYHLDNAFKHTLQDRINKRLLK